jgi:hypothetical protein
MQGGVLWERFVSTVDNGRDMPCLSFYVQQERVAA